MFSEISFIPYIHLIIHFVYFESFPWLVTGFKPLWREGEKIAQKFLNVKNNQLQERQPTLTLAVAVSDGKFLRPFFQLPMAP